MPMLKIKEKHRTVNPKGIGISENHIKKGFVNKVLFSYKKEMS